LTRVSDPHPFHADPNPGFQIFADPDPGFEIFADLGFGIFKDLDPDPGLDFFQTLWLINEKVKKRTLYPDLNADLDLMI